MLPGLMTLPVSIGLEPEAECIVVFLDSANHPGANRGHRPQRIDALEYAVPGDRIADRARGIQQQAPDRKRVKTRGWVVIGFDILSEQVFTILPAAGNIVKPWGHRDPIPGFPCILAGFGLAELSLVWENPTMKTVTADQKRRVFTARRRTR